MKRALRRFIACALAFAAASLPLAGGAVDPYEINAIIPQTGSSAFLGRAFAQTLAVVERLVNASGGIRGRPIKFVVSDDESNPQIAVQIVNGLIAKGVPVVLGPSATSNCNAVMPLLHDGPVLYCLASGVHPAAGSYVWSAGVSTLSTLEVLARYFRERGWYRVGIITSTDATGQEAEQNIDTAFGREKPETVIDREHFNLSDISVSAQMAHLATSHPQAIIAWTVGTPFATLMRGIHDAGLKVPVAASDANLSYSQLEPLRQFLPEELYFASIPSAASVAQMPKGPTKTAQTKYIDAFQAAGIRPEIGNYQIWDEVWIILDALKRLGLDATAPQIRDSIAGLHGWVGVHGPYDFQTYPQRGIGVSSILVARWNAARSTWVNVSLPGGDLAR